MKTFFRKYTAHILACIAIVLAIVLCIVLIRDMASPDAPGHTASNMLQTQAPTAALSTPPATEPTELPHAHSYREESTAPTCMDEGYSVFTCDCGHSYRRNTMAAKGHSWGQWEVIIEATTTAEGKRMRSCEECLTSQEEIIEKLHQGHTHSYSVQIIEPTCTEAGTLVKTCACGDSYVDGSIDPLGHSFTNFISNGDATCDMDGTMTAQCDRCAESCTTMDDGSMLGHRYVANVLAPTCTETGFTDYTCALCGDSYRDSETAATGHVWSDWETTKQPTMEETGLQSRYCNNCERSETKILEKLIHQHSYNVSVTQPTCTEAGYTVYSCACGETYNANTVEATGHSYTAQVTAPTCEKQGFTEYTCVCGESYTGSFVAASGHSWSQWTVTREPTMSAEGLQERNCESCGAKEQLPVDKLPETHTHDYTRERVAATCTESGYAIYTCACGDSYREESAAAKGHSWGDWVITLEPTVSAEGQMERVCERCGTTESDTVEKLPSEGGFVFVSWTETVRRNEEATLTIQGQPGVTYDIDVYYSSGESKAKGLEDQTADTDGYVTWTWKVGGKTAAGTYQIVVTGNDESRTVYFTVVVE